MEASFDRGAVERGIAGTRFRGMVEHYATVGSTNTLAVEAALAGRLCGVWVADEQTAGRGRGGHAWHSRAGDGLYVSLLTRPALAMDRALWLSLATGMAARGAIREVVGETVDIRWPNDLMLGGKKCGGILVETAVLAGTEPPALRHAVIGVGINVDHAAFPPELAEVATSLRLATGRRGSRGWREALLAALLRGMEEELVSLEGGGSALLDRFGAASSWARGKRVRVGEGDGYTGVTAGLDAAGFLLVDGDDGKRRTVYAGGVRGL